MFTERADKVLGKLVALVDVAAYLAYKALLACLLGLRLHIRKVICIRHRFTVAYDARLGNAAYKHSVRAKIDILLYLQRHKRVYVFGQENKTVIGAQRSASRKLVDRASAVEAERLEYSKRRVRAQAVEIHFSRLFDNVMRIVLFVYRYRYAVWRIRDLRNRINNKAVVLPAVVRGDDVEAVAYLEQRRHVVFIRKLWRTRYVVAAKLVGHCLDLLNVFGLNG